MFLGRGRRILEILDLIYTLVIQFPEISTSQGHNNFRFMDMQEGPGEDRDNWSD